MNHSSTTLDAAFAWLGSKSTYAGAFTTIGGWMLSSEFAVLVGMVVGVLGLLVNQHYRRKVASAEIAAINERTERERAEHELRMEKLRTNFSRSNRP